MLFRIFKDQDIFTGCLLIVCGLLGCFFAAQLENLAVAGLSSAFFPSLLFSLMLICGILLIFQGKKRQEKTPFPALRWNQLIPMLLSLTLYVTLLEYVGFIISTIIFVITAMLVFGERNKKSLVIVPITTAVVVYYLFSVAFMIVLP